MAFDFFRIDERLLHGQVLVGWGGRLGIDYYVVVDQALATSAWEQELYASGAPGGVEVLFLDPEAALEQFARLEARPGRGALLTRGTAAMRRLAEAGLLEGRPVNVGGLHAAAGRRRVLDYVYLGEGEVEDLEAIAARAGRVTARDLPTASAIELERLLESHGGA